MNCFVTAASSQDFLAEFRKILNQFLRSFIHKAQICFYLHTTLENNVMNCISVQERCSTHRETFLLFFCYIINCNLIKAKTVNIKTVNISLILYQSSEQRKEKTVVLYFVNIY